MITHTTPCFFSLALNEPLFGTNNNSIAMQLNVRPREMGISMDSLQLLVSWNESSQPTERSQTSVDTTATLSGIYIQGARMTSVVGLEECFVETPSWNPIPLCFLSWVPSEDVVRKKTDPTNITLRMPHLINFCNIFYYRIILGSMDCTL